MGKIKKLLCSKVDNYDRLYVYNNSLIYSRNGNVYIFDCVIGEECLIIENVNFGNVIFDPEGYLYYSKDDLFTANADKFKKYYRYNIKYKKNSVIMFASLHNEYILNNKIFYFQNDKLYSMNFNGKNKKLFWE